MASFPALACLSISFSVFLILTGVDEARSEDPLVLDSQGKIDLKESMKGKREIVVPLDQLDKIDPAQLEGKKKEIIYGKKYRWQSQGQRAIEKNPAKIENYTAPVETNVEGIKVIPDEAETSSPSGENTPKTTP